jgi:cytochrome c oxidase assembly factor CtaG
MMPLEIFAGWTCTGTSLLGPLANTALYLYPLSVLIIPIMLLGGAHNNLRDKLPRPGKTLAMTALAPLLANLAVYAAAYNETNNFICTKEVVSFLYIGPTYNDNLSMVRLALLILIITLSLGMFGLLYVFIRGVETDLDQENDPGTLPL